MSHDEILNLVCRTLSVSIDDLKSTTRNKEVLYARKLSVYYLNNDVPDPHIIAKYFNNSIKTIYRYRGNFYKDLQRDKVLRHYKSLCDAIINN